MSALEETLALHLRAHGIEYEREVRFHPERKFRLDFALPGKLGVEVEGGVWGRKSGHNTGRGILRDMEKHNLAIQQGWRVLRFDGDAVRDGRAIQFILELLEREKAA